MLMPVIKFKWKQYKDKHVRNVKHSDFPYVAQKREDSLCPKMPFGNGF